MIEYLCGAEKGRKFDDLVRDIIEGLRFCWNVLVR